MKNERDRERDRKRKRGRRDRESCMLRRKKTKADRDFLAVMKDSQDPFPQVSGCDACVSDCDVALGFYTRACPL